MDEELGKVVAEVAKKGPKESHKFLSKMDKEMLVSLLTSILKLYMNDKNSSTLREFITTSAAGYTHTGTKIGPDGFKVVGGKKNLCEVKPKNVDTENNKLIKTPRKHNGGGNFTDYTFERLRKDKESGLNMLVSGFIDSNLIFVIEFPFNCKSFTIKLEKQLKKRFPDGDKSGEYLRSAYFVFKDYKDCDDLKVIYVDKGKLQKNKSNFTRILYEFLISK